VLAGEAPGRESREQVTVFDSVGFALEDFSALRLLRDLSQQVTEAPAPDQAVAEHPLPCRPSKGRRDLHPDPRDGTKRREDLRPLPRRASPAIFTPSHRHDRQAVDRHPSSLGCAPPCLERQQPTQVHEPASNEKTRESSP
jgi:hypothetical protein